MSSATEPGSGTGAKRRSKLLPSCATKKLPPCKVFPKPVGSTANRFEAGNAGNPARGGDEHAGKGCEESKSFKDASAFAWLREKRAMGKTLSAVVPELMVSAPRTLMKSAPRRELVVSAVAQQIGEIEKFLPEGGGGEAVISIGGTGGIVRVDAANGRPHGTIRDLGNERTPPRSSAMAPCGCGGTYRRSVATIDGSLGSARRRSHWPKPGLPEKVAREIRASRFIPTGPARGSGVPLGVRPLRGKRRPQGCRWLCGGFCKEWFAALRE